MEIETKIGGYVTFEGSINPRMSKMVMRGEIPAIELRMQGNVPAKAVGHFEQLLDVFGLPERTYDLSESEGIFRILNPLAKRLRPSAVRNADYAGYKIISPSMLICEPEALIKTAENVQYPTKLEIKRAIIARHEGECLGHEHSGRMGRYIAGENTSMKEHVYWVGFADESGFLHLASLDTRFRGHNADISLYLGTPDPTAPDKIMTELKTRIPGIEFKVEDKRFKPTDKNKGSDDELPLPLIASGINLFS
ncbi:MAG: hypothetical protein AABX11_07235 [Nanoarchaeota archaeon]